MIDYRLSYWFNKKVETIDEDGKPTTITESLAVTLARNSVFISVHFSIIGQPKTSKAVYFKTNTEEHTAFDHFFNIIQTYKNGGEWKLNYIQMEAY